MIYLSKLEYVRKGGICLYCEMCKREVGTKKNFNWSIFLIGLLLIGVGAALYLLYYWILAPKVCAICGGKRLLKQAPAPT